MLWKMQCFYIAVYGLYKPYTQQEIFKSTVIALLGFGPYIFFLSVQVNNRSIYNNNIIEEDMG